jgi:serine/threonine protein kinase
MALKTRTEIRTGADWILWRGEDPDSRQFYLVKEVQPQSPYLPTLIHRLRAEHAAFGQLQHPQFARAIGLNATGTQALFSDVQCNLQQYLTAHGPMAPTLVANVMLMLAEGLDYLHGRKFGHGCINTANVFVGPGGDVLFADVSPYTFQSQEPIPVPDPSPKYQAPELIDASLGEPNSSSDLYCLGYLALELLAGSRFESLFDSSEGANWLSWHVDLHRPLGEWRAALPQAPVGLLDIIQQLIEKKPEARGYPTAARLKADLIQSRLTSDAKLPMYRPGRGGTASGPVSFPRPRIRQRTGTLPPNPTRRPKLTLEPIDRAGEPLTFSANRTVLLGSGKGCHVVCPGPAVSPKHTLLTCGPDGVWRAYDLQTPAGTFVNGVARGKARLHPDDELYVAGCGWKVKLDYTKTVMRFDHFQLTHPLHTGRRGRVFRGEWITRERRPVAVRVFPKGFQFDETSLKRFLRGVPETAGIKHPRLVGVFRGGMERKQGEFLWYLATEYMAGGSLQDKLKQVGRLSVPAALRVMAEVAEGATALAERGWIHRNINPGCVLFTAKGQAKLGDFYFAKPASVNHRTAVTAAGDAMEYADAVFQAPECLAGESALTPACDVYSLGATLYMALTGRTPYSREQTPGTVLKQIVAGDLVEPNVVNKAIPELVNELVLKAMAANPEDRYRTPGEFAAAARELLGELAGV